MTELLYQTDSYIRDFEALVTQVVDNGVVLNRTAFYPGGGGQPYDVGTLEFEGQTWEVKRSQWHERDVLHVLDREPPPGGASVVAHLDWERRYALMRTHTALHVMSGVIWRDYGASVTGGNMQVLSGRMDFEFEHMHRDLVEEIEEKINAEVVAAHPIRIYILPREEAFQIPDLIRTKVNLLPPQITEVRVVEIEGLDLQADGGTHVRNTAEVGQIRIVDYKSKGRINKRLMIELYEEPPDGTA